MKSAVIFDIDGTLLDSSSVDGRLYDLALRRVLGPVRIRASWGAYTHVTDDGILKEVLLDNEIEASESLIEEVQNVFFDALSRHIARDGALPEVPGARRFVKTLQRDGIPVAYATGGWGVSAKMKLKSAGFPLSKVPLATSDYSGVRTEIMRMALQELGDGFEKVTYYGDQEWDRAATHELGWHFEAVGAALGGIIEYVADADRQGVAADA